MYLRAYIYIYITQNGNIHQHSISIPSSMGCQELNIGSEPCLQDLEHKVEDIRVCFLHLIEEHQTLAFESSGNQKLCHKIHK